MDEPLPYNAPPPSPRPSFGQNLQLLISSSLFPSGLRFSNSSSSAKSSDKVIPSTKSPRAFDHSLVATKETQMNINKSNKKVTFQTYVVAIAPEHIPTAEEKRLIWYNQADYDGFKFDAAKIAGVQLFDFFPPEAQKQSDNKGPIATTTYPHKFVMLGNFDGDNEVKSSIPSGAAVATSRKKCTTPSYHVPTQCKNEYNDGTGNEGDEICKRGLGYHFSRFRKRNRVWTRVMVLTWQKTMRSAKLQDGGTQDQAPSSQQPLRLSQKCDVKLNEKSQCLLAVVSAKCSRSARQAALWRGRMDHDMAYPENRSGSLDIGPNRCVKTDVADTNKRTASYEGQTCKKRRRCERGNETTAFTYLAGVLSVEI